jgi:pilus assembly protein CpaB
MRTNQVTVLIIAIAMGGIAAYLAQTWIRGQTSASAANQPPGQILVAAEPLAYGGVVTADKVNEVPWFAKTLPEGAFSSRDELLEGGRRVVLSPINRGEPVLRSKVTGPGQRASLSSLLGEGLRAVTVRVDDVRGVAGFVLPGDFVDFVMIASEGTNKRQSYSDVLLEHLKVLAIDQIADEGEGKPTLARAVTVEATKEQAQKILLATDVGKLSLILNHPAESASTPNRRISERDIGRIIPEPPPRPAPAPAAPVAAPPPSNMAKVLIIRNGESKEYAVQHSDGIMVETPPAERPARAAKNAGAVRSPN